MHSSQTDHLEEWVDQCYCSHFIRGQYS